ATSLVRRLSAVYLHILQEDRGLCTVLPMRPWLSPSFLQLRKLVSNKGPMVNFVRDQVEKHAADRLLALLAVQAVLLQDRFRICLHTSNRGRMGLVQRLADHA